ncbi:c-type cytochrome [Paracoccus sp. (in: a-proteobacteria)]|uniref:c-type cytochrome n=1 Tax=Paracoccus sp. TaxID=267 RepID=UPI00272D5D57|nr:cytochrome c [Paracoccus sp. (in: a-proteobacteria)]
MRIKLYLPSVAGVILLLTGTAMGQTTSAPAVQPPAKDADLAPLFADVTTDGPVSAEIMTVGEGLFRANCRQCHGSKGTAGVPLKENEKLADAYYLTGTILTGPGYMTGFAEHLDDTRIAAIASFVRNSWGNDYGAVTPQDVADLR